MATLKDIGDFQAELLAKGFREIDENDLVDMLQSLANVQGVLSINNAPMDPLNVNAVNFVCPNNTWNMYDQWQDSTDVQGIQEQPTPGAPPFDGFLIKPAGSGDWNAVAYWRGQCDRAATVQIRLAVVDTDGITVMTEPFRDRQVVTVPGEPFALGFQALVLSVLDGQKLIMQIRAVNNAVLTAHDAQFWAKRG